MVLVLDIHNLTVSLGICRKGLIIYFFCIKVLKNNHNPRKSELDCGVSRDERVQLIINVYRINLLFSSNN